MSSTVHPVSGLPSTRIQGKPPGRRSSRSCTRARTLARAEAIFASWTGPIPSRVRYSVDADAGLPSTSAACRITVDPGDRARPQQHRARRRHQHRAPVVDRMEVPAHQRPPSVSVSPTLSARRRTGTIPALPTSFRPPVDSDRPSAHSVSFDTRRVPPPQHDPVLEKPIIAGRGTLLCCPYTASPTQPGLMNRRGCGPGGRAVSR